MSCSLQVGSKQQFPSKFAHKCLAFAYSPKLSFLYATIFYPVISYQKAIAHFRRQTKVGDVIS